VPIFGDGYAICHPSKMMVLNQSNFQGTTAGFRSNLLPIEVRGGAGQN
jgi:hypothetical protein